MVARASWLTRSCSSFAWPMASRAWSPCHHCSDPKMSTDGVRAVMTSLQLAGERPICPASRRSRAIAFFPLFSRMAWWSLSVSHAKPQANASPLFFCFFWMYSRHYLLWVEPINFVYSGRDEVTLPAAEASAYYAGTYLPYLIEYI